MQLLTSQPQYQDDLNNDSVDGQNMQNQVAQ